LLSALGGTEQEVVARDRRFVAEAKSLASPWALRKHQVFLGSEAFVEDVRQALLPERDLSEVPRAQRRSPARPLGEYAKRYPDRNEAITAAYASGGYTLKEIGQYFGLHYAHVSRVISRARKAKYKTPPD